jgi:DNA-binding NarL/FixJ family response regulator
MSYSANVRLSKLITSIHPLQNKEDIYKEISKEILMMAESFLTERQLTIYKLYIAGLSVKEISEQLGVAEGTIEASIHGKSGILSKIQTASTTNIYLRGLIEKL